MNSKKVGIIPRVWISKEEWELQKAFDMEQQKKLLRIILEKDYKKNIEYTNATTKTD